MTTLRLRLLDLVSCVFRTKVAAEGSMGKELGLRRNVLNAERKKHRHG